MRRILGGLAAFLVLTGTLLVLPVYAAPAPAARPVAPSVDEVELGSVDRPRDAAVVTADGAVVDAGPRAAVDAPAGGEAGRPATRAAGDAVASSGRELGGVPALTVADARTAGFSAVGVTWAQDPAVTAVTVQLRTRDAAGGWSAWETVEQDGLGEAAQAAPGGEVRGGTAPVWTGPARGVEVIVQAADGSTPRDVQVELIDPGSSPADGQLGAPAITDQAGAAMAMPPIYSRAQWGADESLMGWEPEYAPTLQAATLHYTASGNDYAREDVPAILRSIYAYHANSRGWGDIGYNVLVDRFGRAWEGRSGGLASTVIGAHAGGFNTGTTGVAMIGNYDVAPVPQAALTAVADVMAWKLSLYGVDPNATTTLVSAGGGTARYPAGTPVTLPTIFGHRDVGNTADPGRYGYPRIPELRTLVAARVTALGPAVMPTVPRGRTLLRNDNVSGSAQWTTERGQRGDVPIACDWDGSGNETVGIFRAGRFLIYNSNDTSAPPVADFGFGNPGDTPLCGDWDGDGKAGVGVWRNGWFFLRNSTTAGPADGAFAYGNRDAQPVVGNWDGDPYDSVGVYQVGALYYANSNLRPVANGVVPFGNATDRVVVGDWTGTGRDSVGVFRRGTFYLSNVLGRSRADRIVPYGDVSDRPLVADWDGNRTTTIGVTRGY